MNELKKIETGQGLAEYSIVLALIAIVVIIALRVFGLQIGSLYGSVTSTWP